MEDRLPVGELSHGGGGFGRDAVEEEWMKRERELSREGKDNCDPMRSEANITKATGSSQANSELHSPRRG